MGKELNKWQCRAEGQIHLFHHLVSIYTHPWTVLELVGVWMDPDSSSESTSFTWTRVWYWGQKQIMGSLGLRRG